MEFDTVRRGKNRRRKRSMRKKRREKIKIEVMTGKHCKFPSKCSKSNNIFVTKDRSNRSNSKTMQADAFWKNYTAAQEWQRRHNMAWWKSRCYALEYENIILRNKIREFASGDGYQESMTKPTVCSQEVLSENDEELISNEDDLEFHIDEDMMNFLEQSIRHKMELKRNRESAIQEEASKESKEFEGATAWVTARNDGGKLLYGDASSKILAMETALQTTLDRHRDKTKPQYWPNIPLKL